MSTGCGLNESERTMKILDELFRYTQSLKRVPLVDQTRLCLLVDQEEWDEISREFKALRRFPDAEPPEPRRRYVYGVEVRKR